MKNKIILGTANFSNKYGLINKQKIKQNSLLKCANKFGIKFLDTSPLYGKAEKKIGKSKIKFQIITKIPKITNKWTSPRSWVLKSISSTQKNVKQKILYGALIHHVQDLKKKRGKILYNTLQDLKKDKKIKKIGISIYSLVDLKWILRKFDFDIIQLPFNVFNRELINGHWIEKLKRRKIEIHCRSIFLQGLLLTKKKLPRRLLGLEKKIHKFSNWTKAREISTLQASLNFVLKFKKIDKIIIGADDCTQLKEIMKISKYKSMNIPKFFEIKKKRYINPTLW